MQLFYFLLLIVSLSCGSLPSTDVDLVRASFATTAMVLAWITLSHVAARMCAVQVAREKIDPIVAADWMEKQLAVFRWLGLAVSVYCLAGFGLARGLDEVPWIGESMFLQSWILLAPAVAITVGTWSAEHCYGVMLGYTPPGIKNWIASLWLSGRSTLGWLAVPVLILLGISDLISSLPITATTSGGLTIGFVLLMVPIGLPWMIRRVFKTTPLDRATATWVAELMKAAGLKRTHSLRWDTGGTTFNAMVAGFVPPLRTLLMSDRLLDQLPREQIAMVVLHEAAHIGRRHVPLRMLAIIPAWVAGVAITRLMGDQPWAIVLGSVIAITATVLVLRLVAYRTEYDADVHACRLAEKIGGRIEGVPSNYQRACDALASALMRVTFEQPASRKATWLHPGVADRIAWMRRQREFPSASTTNAGTIANPA